MLPQHAPQDYGEDRAEERAAPEDIVVRPDIRDDGRTKRARRVDGTVSDRNQGLMSKKYHHADAKWKDGTLYNRLVVRRFVQKSGICRN